MGRGAFVDPRAGQVAFTDYSTEWLAERDLRPRTHDVYADLLHLHLEPTFGATELGAIAPSSVRSWYSRLNRKHPATAAKAYRLLRAILRTAVDDELIARSPCKVTGAGADRSPERPVATVAEVDAITDAMPEWMAITVTLAVWCGLRRAEILGLRRRDVDLAASVLRIERTANQLGDGTIVFGPPKTDAGVRSVAIPPNVVGTLTNHMTRFVNHDPDALVVTGAKGGPLRPHVLGAAWRKARLSVGRPDLHFHDLRHSLNVWAAAVGATTKELMRRLGHASPAAALRYQHATEDSDRVIANAMAELVPLAPVVPLPKRK